MGEEYLIPTQGISDTHSTENIGIQTIFRQMVVWTPLGFRPIFCLDVWIPHICLRRAQLFMTPPWIGNILNGIYSPCLLCCIEIIMRGTRWGYVKGMCWIPVETKTLSLQWPPCWISVEKQKKMVRKLVHLLMYLDQLALSHYIYFPLAQTLDNRC